MTSRDEHHEERRRNTGERRIKVAELSASGYKPGEIADMLGVHRTTIHNDLNNPLVKEERQVMRSAALERLADIARDAADDALKTLRNALTDDDAGIRVRSAQSLLQALTPLINHGELHSRLDRLEQAMKDSGTVVPEQQNTVGPLTVAADQGEADE